MRVLLIASAKSTHTVRWANGLAERGVEVHVASVLPSRESLHEGVQEHRLPGGRPFGYLRAVRPLARLARQIDPHLVNVHYASGYGSLARWAALHPRLLSVWGSDVYDFPRKSPLHRRVFKANVESADAVASTSEAMAREVRRWSQPKEIFITPFGVDPDLFSPLETEVEVVGEAPVVVGTVKKLMPQYGVDTLIRAFAIVRDHLREERGASGPPVRLRIVGGGEDRSALEKLTADLGLADVTEFRGRVPHGRVPRELAEIDVYVALSRTESFGVAILEANACGKPTVVSDADGPKEVTEDGVTGLIVPRDDPQSAAGEILRLVRDPDERRRLGRAGRDHVLAHYTWERSVDRMMEAYERTMELAGGRGRARAG